MTAVDDTCPTWADKGPWTPDGEPTASLVGTSLFAGGFTWPVMTLSQSALATNLVALARFTDETGMLFAPHGKTPMAPVLWRKQVDAGAWGITVATANQVAIARHFGMPRVLLANELLDPAAWRWIATEVAAGFEFYAFCDSVEGLDAVVAGNDNGALGEVDLLIDLGYPGGRTGCRTASEAFELARRIRATDGVRLAGVGGYEGGLADVDAVARYLTDLQTFANQAFTEQLLTADAMVTAGGSKYFDVVADAWREGWAPEFRPRRVLRSGAYVTHDHGIYQQTTPFNRIGGHLDAAIRVWTQVTSAGDLDGDIAKVIVGMGRRDAPEDSGLPVVLGLRRRGSERIENMSGELQKMDDHHGYLLVDAAVGLRPGDLVCFGLSHPCTSFDRWRVMPIVDDDHTVVEFVRTYF